MALTRTIVLAGCLLTASAARAQDSEPPSPVVPDVVYKGLVGKALDAVPMDAENRVVLQRTNAVVSNTLTARSVSVWVGLTNPVLLVAGLAWGVYAALNIKAPQTIAKTDVKRVEPIELEQLLLALESNRPAAKDNAKATFEAGQNQVVLAIMRPAAEDNTKAAR